MKQKQTKILVALVAIILIVGAIIIFTKGLAFELKYRDSKKIEINLGKEFQEKEIKDITKEVFGNQQVIIEPIEVYKDAMSITTTDISEEQKANLITKINEKYETELSADNITIEEDANVRGRDIVKHYIIPFAVVTIIILGYIIIRYNKLNFAKVLIQSISIIVLSQLILLAIMAITRMPVGTFTIPVVLVIYLLSTFACTCKFEKDLEKLDIKEE